MANRNSATIVSTVMLFAAGLLISLFQNCGGKTPVDEVGSPSLQGLPVIVFSLSSGGPPITSEVPFDAVVFTRVENVTENDFVGAATLAGDCPPVGPARRIGAQPSMRLIRPGVFESRENLADFPVGAGLRSCASRSNALRWDVEETLDVGPRPVGPISVSFFDEQNQPLAFAKMDQTVITRVTGLTRDDYAVSTAERDQCPPISNAFKISTILSQPGTSLVDIGNNTYQSQLNLLALDIRSGGRTCLARNGATTWEVNAVLPVRSIYYAKNADGGGRLPIVNGVQTVKQNEEFYSIVTHGYGPKFFICNYFALSTANPPPANVCLTLPTNPPTANWSIFNGISSTYLSHCTSLLGGKLISCLNSPNPPPPLPPSTFPIGQLKGYLFENSDVLNQVTTSTVLNIIP